MDYKNKRDDGGFIQNSDKNQKEKDQPLIIQKNTDQENLNQSQNHSNDNSQDLFLEENQIGKTIADEEAGLKKFEKSSKKNITDGPEQIGLERQNEESENLECKNIKDQNNHMIDGLVQEKEPFNLERILQKTTKNFIFSSINIFFKFLICIVISPFFMLVVMWLVSDKIIVANFGTISSVNYSRWQKIQDDAEKENKCCKGLCKTWCKILFFLWAAFNFIIAPIITALPVLFGYTLIILKIDELNGLIITNLLDNLKKKRKVDSIAFLFEMKSISKINQPDNFEQDPNKYIEYIKLGLYAACHFWNLSMLILTPIITLYLVIFWPFLWVCMQFDQFSYHVIKALFNDFEVFEDVQSYNPKDSGCCPKFCCFARKKQDEKTIQIQNLWDSYLFKKNNKVHNAKTQNIDQENTSQDKPKSGCRSCCWKDEEQELENGFQITGCCSFCCKCCFICFCISKEKEKEETIDYSQNRYHRKKIEIIKEKMEERKIKYEGVKNMLKKVELEQTQYEKWLDQDMMHTEDKLEFEKEIKKQKIIRQQEMQENWKSYQIESDKVKVSKIKMKNELNAWKIFHGAHYDENELQIKVKELEEKKENELKAWKEKRGTHFDPNDLQKKINELNQKKKEYNLKAIKEKRGIDFDPKNFKKKLKNDANKIMNIELKAWKDQMGTSYDQIQLMKQEKEAKEKIDKDLEIWKQQFGPDYDKNEFEKKEKEAQKQMEDNMKVWQKIKTTHFDPNQFLEKEKEAQKKMEEKLKQWKKQKETPYDPNELENMEQREEILKNKLQSYQKDPYIVDITEQTQKCIDKEMEAQKKRLNQKNDIEFEEILETQKNIRKKELLQFWENLLNEPCEVNITEQAKFIEDLMKKEKENRRDKFVEDELQEWVKQMKNLQEIEKQLLEQENAEQYMCKDDFDKRFEEPDKEATADDFQSNLKQLITQFKGGKRSNDEIKKQTEENREEQQIQKMKKIYQKELYIKLINQQVKNNILDELKQWEIERNNNCKQEKEIENQKKQRTNELLNLLKIYQKERDQVEITEEALKYIKKELDEWEKERIIRWDQKQSCATFLFDLRDINFEDNEDAYELFWECLLGFSFIIWNATNFLFQPALLIFYIVMFIPIKILLLIGLNLPGNKYNLVVFNFKGKKQYQSNCCAFTSIFIVVFIAYYFFIQFKGVGMNLDVTQQNMLFSSNKAISKNFSSITYIPFQQYESMFLKRLPSLQIKNFDQSQDLCSDYKNQTDSEKLKFMQMRLKLTNGTKILPISQSLKCQSKKYTDEKNNFQFQAFSFYVDNDVSNWLLKTADPEFYQNKQQFNQNPLNASYLIFHDDQIVDNSYEIILNKSTICKPNSTINVQLIHYDVQLNSEFQSPGKIEDLFIANSAMIGQNTQNINICQASVNSQQIQLRKRFTQKPLDKWQELWYKLNPIGQREIYYSYTIDNTIDYNIDENEFSLMDSLTHFKFKFAQNKTDFMTKVTLERSTLLQAIYNIGSILPLIISIHTAILALVVPKWFNKLIYKEYKFQLVQLSYLKDQNKTKTDPDKQEQAKLLRKKVEDYINETLNNVKEIKNNLDEGKENDKQHQEGGFGELSKNSKPQSDVIKKIPISDQEFKKQVDKETKKRQQKQLVKENKVLDELNSILSYQGFIDLNYHAFQQEEKNLLQEKQILDQDEKIKVQEKKINEQEKKIQGQDKKIQGQDIKIQGQEKKFQDQELKIQDQEKKFQDQELKIQDQEKKFQNWRKKQGKEIKELRDQIDDLKQAKNINAFSLPPIKNIHQ